MSNLQSSLKSFIIGWNNLYPLDKWWRDKYNIPFNSKSHLDACQADIFLEYMEYQLYEDYTTSVVDGLRKSELLKKGEWISSNDVSEEISDDEFDKIEI